jgi:Ser/Thr protein kinase RdoA (MazF antagonist)
MENRVYEVEIDLDFEPEIASENFVIAKFYRPGRWSFEQISQEHEFLFDLTENEITVIAPLKFDGESIFKNSDGLMFSLFPKKVGRSVDEYTEELLEQMGRLLARMHNIGSIKKADKRIRLDLKTYGENNLEYILKSKYLPVDLKRNYEQTCLEIFKLSEPLFKDIKYQRIHGDCHHGNILYNHNPFLIDFDDMVRGPAVQDIWMITPGRDEYSKRNFNILIDAYTDMREFDFREIKLIETLRALRMIHFSSWIAHRFEDEAFKRAFSHFGTNQYWEKELFDLKEQILYIQDNVDSLI